MLPPISGSDLTNAYMSYIVDSDNPHIHAKYNAIQRFLHCNILSERNQEEFMESFIIIIKACIEEINEEQCNEENKVVDEFNGNVNKEKEE
jgi:hypothetical protein